MLRVIYKGEIWEVEEISNLPLRRLADEFLIASGHFQSRDILKPLAVFMEIKKNKFYIAYVQDAVGRKRIINIPLFLYNGVVCLGIRKKGYVSLEGSRFEKVELLCFKNAKLVEIEDPNSWVKTGGHRPFRKMVDIEILQTLLESEGYTCEYKKAIFE